MFFLHLFITPNERMNKKKGKRNCIVDHKRYREPIDDIIHLRKKKFTIVVETQ